MVFIAAFTERQYNHFDPHKKYIRMGECKRCGRCCDLHCPNLKWVANRDVKTGERFVDLGIGETFMYECTANPKPDMCIEFPTSPWQTPPKCGFYWVEGENADLFIDK